MTVPVLWHFTGSHYNEKARWALDFKGITHVRRALLPGAHVPRIRKMTGQTAVPVLELDGRIIHDSTRIIEALERAKPEPPLYPRDDDERRRALDLETFFDEELGPHIRRAAFHATLDHPDVIVGLFGHEAGSAAKLAFRAAFPLLRVLMKRSMQIDEITAKRSVGKTLAALDRIESELRPSGYLVGDRFGVADLTAAALFSPLAAPPEFPYRLPEMPRPLVEFRESVRRRPAFQWVLEMYRRHRGRSAAVAA